jgi:hypothetical protein
MKNNYIKSLIQETLQEMQGKFIPSEGIEIKPYVAKGGYTTRFFGVYEDGNLLTVSVYKKGAEVIANRPIELKRAAQPIDPS